MFFFVFINFDYLDVHYFQFSQPKKIVKVIVKRAYRKFISCIRVFCPALIHIILEYMNEGLLTRKRLYKVHTHCHLSDTLRSSTKPNRQLLDFRVYHRPTEIPM